MCTESYNQTTPIPSGPCRFNHGNIVQQYHFTYRSSIWCSPYSMEYRIQSNNSISCMHDHPVPNIIFYMTIWVLNLDFPKRRPKSAEFESSFSVFNTNPTYILIGIIWCILQLPIELLQTRLDHWWRWSNDTTNHHQRYAYGQRYNFCLG